MTRIALSITVSLVTLVIFIGQSEGKKPRPAADEPTTVNKASSNRADIDIQETKWKLAQLGLGNKDGGDPNNYYKLAKHRPEKDKNRKQSFEQDEYDEEDEEDEDEEDEEDEY